jgi:cytochrome c-type biogenesis protein CcmE
MPEANPRERALWEKEVLGFQFGDHPFQEAFAWLGSRLTHDSSQIGAELSGERVVLGGLVTGVRKIVTRNHAEMAILTLEDLAGSIEVVVFPRVFDKIVDLCREDKILVVEGKIDSRNEQPQIVADRAEEWLPPERGTEPPLARLAAQGSTTDQTGNGSNATSPLNGGSAGGNGAHGGAGVEAPRDRRVLRVVVPRDQNEAACLRVLEQLHGLVERNPGEDAIELVLRDRSGEKVELAGAEIRIRHSPELENQVRVLVGSENVSHGRSDAPQPGA